MLLNDNKIVDNRLQLSCNFSKLQVRIILMLISVFCMELGLKRKLGVADNDCNATLSLHPNHNEIKSLSEVGGALGFGRTRFYQWCRGRGLLTRMNTPTQEMTCAGYMIVTQSESGYPRVYVTKMGLDYVGGMFRDDLEKGMVKLNK